MKMREVAWPFQDKCSRNFASLQKTVLSGSGEANIGFGRNVTSPAEWLGEQSIVDSTHIKKIDQDRASSQK
jgi:hypothetical protein